jgi:hypothetical protein
MASSIPVVNTYACHTIERILTLKNPASNKGSLFTVADLQPVMGHLIMNFLTILQPTTGENEYAMKGIILTKNDHALAYKTKEVIY